AVAVDDPVAPANDPAGGEVGAGDDLEQLVEADVGVIDDLDDGVADFAEVVGQQVARHADGDAGGAVHQEVGELGGEDGRLGARVVGVGGVVAGVELPVGET